MTNNTFQKVRNCFSTERARLKRAHQLKTNTDQKHDPRECEAGLRELAKALVPLRTLELDARGLFRERNDADIRARASGITAGTVGASYQKALSEMWKEADKKLWEEELQNSVDIYA
jgi:hypothetical protein